MAAKATFDADFSKFEQAAAGAQAKLSGFEGSAAKVQKSMDRIADSLSGRRLIQDALLTAQAIDKIGASALTAAEKSQKFNQISEAMEKLKARGEQIPPVMQKAADATKQIPKNITAAEEAAKGLATALGGVFSIQALVNFGKELLDTADHIQKVADQTGLLTDEVQQLEYIGSQTGNSLDEMTSAVTQMQNRIASGDDSAIAALKRLNLSFDDLKNLDPYEQLVKISQGFQNVKNPASQAQLAMDLFGKSGAQILPTLKSDMAALGKEAPIMSENTVKALDSAGDSLAKFQLQIKVWAAEAYNSLSGLFDKAVAAVYRYIASLADSIAGLYGWLAKIPGITKVMPTLKDDIKGLTENAQWFRDAASAMEQQTNKTTAAVRAAVPPLVQVKNAHKEGATEADKHAKALEAMFNELSGKDLIGKIRDLDAVTRRLAEAGKLSGEGLKKVVEQAREYADAGGELTPRLAALVAKADEFQHVLDLVTLSNQHHAAAAKYDEAAWKAWEGTVSKALATLKTAPVLLQSRDLSGLVPQIDTSKIPTAAIPKPAGPGLFTQLFGDAKTFGAQLTQAIGGALSSGGGGGGVASAAAGLMGSSLGSAVAGNLGKSLLKQGAGLFSQALGGVLSSALPMVGSLIGPLAGKLWNSLFGTAGRDAVKDFAASLGGFDALHAKLGELGAEGERLWIQLTQGTGRNNPEQAKAAIEAINAALDANKTKTEAAAGAAQAAADAWVSGFKKAHDAAQGQIDDLTKQIEGYQQSIAQEAPEEEMGVIEKMTREKIAALEKEKDARQEALDQWTEAAKQAGADAANLIDAALTGREYHITVIPDVRGLPPVPAYPQAAGGDYLVSKPTLFLAGEAGPERATFRPGGGRGGGGDTSQTIVVSIGDEVIARAAVRGMPRQFALRGL